jgi:uncharacterized protein (TIGR00159 family)
MLSDLLANPLPVRWNDVVDVLLVAALLWAALVWLRRSRARLALGGLAILGGVYLVARQLDLELTVWILQGFFAVLVVVLVVVFQEDLKRVFEQIALWGLGRRPPAPPVDLADTLARTAHHLARTRTGALIVLPGKAPLDRHVEGGIPLDARLSEPLLLSLFDAHSPGHDGAVVIAGGRVTRFAVHLPLSSDQEQLAGVGTRHAAALGLAERSDALTVVVSEERGSVSVAVDARLRRLDTPERLAGELRAFLARVAPPPDGARRGRLDLLRRWPEALASLLLAGLMWTVLVPGAGVIQVTREAEVAVENLPPGYALEGVEPARVEVTLSGPRRLVYLSEPQLLTVHVDALLAELGRRTFQIAPEQVDAPPGLEIVATRPDRVRLSLRQRAPEAAAPGTGPG